jgi:hypothetical protein
MQLLTPNDDDRMPGLRLMPSSSRPSAPRRRRAARPVPGADARRLRRARVEPADEIVGLAGTHDEDRAADVDAARTREEIVETRRRLLGLDRRTDPSQDQVITERAYAMLSAFADYFKTKPNETLGGACREALVTPTTTRTVSARRTSRPGQPSGLHRHRPAHRDHRRTHRPHGSRRKGSPVATVKLRNINPLGQVDLPIAARQGEPLGEHGTGCLEPGEVFEVDATSPAGHRPATRRRRLRPGRGPARAGRQLRARGHPAKKKPREGGAAEASRQEAAPSKPPEDPPPAPTPLTP